MKQDVTKMFGTIILFVFGGAMSLISASWLLCNPPIDRLLDIIICSIFISVFLIGTVCVCVAMQRVAGWAFCKLVRW